MMKDGPYIARIAALIGDHARAEVLTALMADRALTATELADIAGVSKPTISAHLAQLLDANLIAVEPQGRHRYFRLADPDVAQLLESLMGVAFRSGAVRLRGSPREPALRKARVCYDHLAGELGATGSPRTAWTRTRWPRSAAAFAAPAWTGASAATIWPAPWALPCWRVSMRWAGRAAPRTRAWCSSPSRANMRFASCSRVLAKSY